MNERTPITIAGIDYNVGFSFYAIKLFHEKMGKSNPSEDNVWENINYIYCVLKALNENFKMSLDEFVEILDADPKLLIDLTLKLKQPDESQEPEPAAKPQKKNMLKTLFVLWMLSVLLLALPVLIPGIFGLIVIFVSLKILYRYIANLGSKLGSLFRHSRATA